MTLSRRLFAPLAIGTGADGRYVPDRHPQPDEIWTDVDWYDRLRARRLPLPLAARRGTGRQGRTARPSSSSIASSSHRRTTCTTAIAG
jgi:hypothetical protein